MQIVGCKNILTAAPVYRVFQLLTFLALLFFTFPVSAQDHPTERRVLILHSYNQGFYWADHLQNGFEGAFAESKIDAEFFIEYMDMKRFGEAGKIFPAFRDLLRSKYADSQPDVIISCDSDALDFLFQYRDTLFPDVPVVFCGLDVSDYDASLFEGRQGYTGVVEKVDLGSTVDLILQLQPKVKRVVFVHDLTSAGRSYSREAEKIVKDYSDRVAFDFLGGEPGLSEAELLESLEGLGPDSAVYFLGFFRDRNGKSLAPEHIVPRVCEHSPVAVYTFADAMYLDGVLGGKMFTADEHGRLTARKAIRLLEGQKIEDEPVWVGSSNAYVFDYRQLKHFGISPSALPPGSEVRNGPSSFMEEHGRTVFAVIGVLFVLLILIGLLLFDVLRRLSVERRLVLAEKERTRESERAASYLNLMGNVVIALDREGKVELINKSGARLIGLPEDQIVGENWFEKFIPEQQRESVFEGFRSLISGDVENIEYFENAIIKASGEERTIAWHNTVLNDEEGEITGTLSSGTDITEQLLAQESLRLSEEKHRALYLNAPLPYQSLDAEGCLLDVNPAWLRTLGYEREDVIGHWFGEFLQEDQVELFRARFPIFKKEGSVSNVEFIMRRKNGDMITVVYEGCASYTPDGAFRQTYCVFQDITERRKAERDLKEAEAFRRNVMETAPFGVLVFDIQREVFDYVNAPFQEIVGYAEPEILTDRRGFLDLIIQSWPPHMRPLA